MVFAAQATQVASLEMNEMTEVPNENQAVVCGGTPQTEQKIAIRVKLDRAEERVVGLEPGATVARILEIVATERGDGTEDLVVVREGEGEPLPADVVVDTGYPRKCRHYVHYPGEIKVTVYYQAGQDTREFKRFEAVKDVLAWAISAFKVDASLATELALVRHGQKDELPEREHIGHVAGKDSDLVLDLVRGDIANGSCA